MLMVGLDNHHLVSDYDNIFPLVKCLAPFMVPTCFLVENFDLSYSYYGLKERQVQAFSRKKTRVHNAILSSHSLFDGMFMCRNTSHSPLALENFVH